MFGTFRSPNAVYFGAGQRAMLGRVVSSFGRRTLICTDERLAADPMFRAMVEDIGAAGVDVSVFSRTIPDLPLGCIDEALAHARSAKPDSIVAIGGGSCLDLAKTTALIHTLGGRPQDYYGEFKVAKAVLPVIAVPTTSGTGSEVTPVAVLSDPDKTLKVGISDPRLIPAVAICDPELTLSCPASLTAVAGADALTHGIESFTAIRRNEGADLPLERVFVGKNIISDHHALESIRLISGALVGAVEDGSRLDLRSQLMFGAMLAGHAFANAGNAAAHALQYPVGALTHTAHGVGVAALMPYVMRFNLPARRDEYAQVAAAMGVPPKGDAKAMAEASIDAVTALFAAVGIPRTLAELGFQEGRIGWAAEQAMTAARLVQNNPMPLDVESMKTILQAAYHGDPRLLS
ncbi:alcohol dehydrogenase [Mesorhizobium tianshanense]|uniref:Alcohol dehydrogenase n=1 Tax=Mesorhizobium tianshanense TaxID=39844 RepID=A0A562N3L0_9HYPH|nr:iron-containing alcohol dehydrogenase [Mesorhizobium tianshanense]TWI26779.1 alcohol dehydrogenase [Mesorhizobium tianshanense]GLS36334.1 alcohol dehydrogenase [Mesorhizobium tianshanense]